MEKAKSFVKKKILRKGRNKMKKNLIICILIVVVVISSDLIIKKKIFKDFDYTISVLNEVDEQKDNETRMNEIENLESFFESKYLLMAFYIDHVELEKIKTQIIILKAGVDEADESFLHEEIQRTIVIINHLKQKIDFKLENIL